MSTKVPVEFTLKRWVKGPYRVNEETREPMDDKGNMVQWVRKLDVLTVLGDPKSFAAEDVAEAATRVVSRKARDSAALAAAEAAVLAASDAEVADAEAAMRRLEAAAVPEGRILVTKNITNKEVTCVEDPPMPIASRGFFPVSVGQVPALTVEEPVPKKTRTKAKPVTAVKKPFTAVEPPFTAVEPPVTAVEPPFTAVETQ
jgi:hypothetical protein